MTVLDLERKAPSSLHQRTKIVMESAISLKYSGMSIEASKADYADYADLGLVCEYCHAPVFLVKSRQVKNQKPRRTSNGKLKKFRSYKTKPYFAHFKSEDDSDCLLRTNSDAARALRLKTIADGKQQRLEIFTNRIGQILLLNPHLDNARMLDSLWQRNFLHHHPKNQANSLLRKQVALVRSEIQQIKKSAFEIISEYETGEYSHLDYLNNAIEIELHQQTTDEAIDYLCSGSSYELLAWLYRLADIETRISHRISQQILQTRGELSPQYNNFLIFGNYIVQSYGIFGFRQQQLIDRTSLEQIFNSPIPETTDLKAICNLIGAVVALTSWSVGFETNCLPRIPQINSYFVVTKSTEMNGYLTIDPSSSQLYFDGGKKLDLKAWTRLFGSKLFRTPPHDRTDAEVSLPLPAPLNELSLVATSCWSSKQDRVVELYLTRGNEIVAEAKFWYAMNTKSKKLRSSLKGFIKNLEEIEIALKSPTLTLRSSLSINYERITISLINSLFCYWNNTFAK